MRLNLTVKFFLKTSALLNNETRIVWQHFHFQCLPFRSWQILLMVWTF